MRKDWKGVVFNHCWTPGPSKTLQSCGLRKLQSPYWFPRTAITDHHKSCGLKHEKCILSSFWTLELQHQFLRANPRSGQVCALFFAPPLRSRWSPAFLGLWPHRSLPACVYTSPSPLRCALCVSSPSSSLSRAQVTAFRGRPDTPG